MVVQRLGNPLMRNSERNITLSLITTSFNEYRQKSLSNHSHQEQVICGSLIKAGRATMAITQL